MKGKRLKELRESKGISQVDLAIKINESKQTLYKYENDIITNVPSDKIELMAEVLDCSPAYLMGWIDTPLMKDYKEIVDYYAKGDELSLEETEIIERYRIASKDTQNAICSILGIKRQDTPLKSSKAV